MRGKGRTKDGDRAFDAANQKRDRRKRHDHNREKTKGGLAAGVYRMGIPFSFTYYYGGYQASAAKATLRKNPDKKAYDFYYATTVAEPNFYFRGDGLCSTWDAEITTNYTLYGTFTVE